MTYLRGNVMLYLKTALVFLLSASVFCCNSSKISDSTIKKQIIKYHHEYYNSTELGEIVKIENIVIHNGLYKEEKGIISYLAFVEYDFIFLKEYDEIMNNLKSITNNAGEKIQKAKGLQEGLNQIIQTGSLLKTLLEIAIYTGGNRKSTLRQTILLKKGDKGWFISSTEFGWNEQL